jgi:heat shock protein HtpX
MIDDDVRGLKRKVFLNKTYSLLAFLLTAGLPLIPVALLFFLKAGTFGKIVIIASMLIYLASIILLVRHGAWFVQRLTGAVTIDPGDFNDLKSLSEDISIATGRPLPELMLIDDRQCCNLFSVKRKGHAVIFVGPKVLEIFDRDELRAAIAHEMAHIHNGDAKINTATVTFRALSQIILNLPSTLGFRRVEMIVLLVTILSFTLLAFAFINGFVFILLFSLFFPLLWFYVFGHNFTLFLPSIELKRDFCADELAVKWTLQPEALIGAMQKAQIHDESKRIFFLEVIPFVPTTFENPHKDMESTSVRERIDNLAQVVRLPPQ